MTASLVVCLFLLWRFWQLRPLSVMYTVLHVLSKGDGRVPLSWPRLRRLYKGRKCSLWCISEEIFSMHCQNQLDEPIYASIVGISLGWDLGHILGDFIALVVISAWLLQALPRGDIHSALLQTLEWDLTLHCYFIDQYDFTHRFIYTGCLYLADAHYWWNFLDYGPFHWSAYSAIVKLSSHTKMQQWAWDV